MNHSSLLKPVNILSCSFYCSSCQQTEGIKLICAALFRCKSFSTEKVTFEGSAHFHQPREHPRISLLSWSCEELRLVFKIRTERYSSEIFNVAKPKAMGFNLMLFCFLPFHTMFSNNRLHYSFSTIIHYSFRFTRDSESSMKSIEYVAQFRTLIQRPLPRCGARQRKVRSGDDAGKVL